MSAAEHSQHASMLGGDPLRVILTTFCGVRAAQTWADYYLWELLLNAHPDLRAIVEIGTAWGGFSRYLSVQAEARGLEFRTYDAVVPELPAPGFERIDVFIKGDEVMRYLRSREPLILLCDGGNKPREVGLFGTRLKPGSLVVVHDWMTEFLPADVPDILAVVYEDVCEKLGSMSRVLAPQ